MDNFDYYEVLGVDKTTSFDEIKKNYRRLCKLYHPDKNPNDKEAEDMFKRISIAYETLSDSKKKAEYDNRASAHSFFDSFGFGKRQEVKTGENISLAISLTLEEIYTGVSKKYKYNRFVNCDSCDGFGGHDVKKCVVCDGSGVKLNRYATPFGTILQHSECDVCNGAGRTYENICTTCSGEGLIRQEEIVEIEIPHGVTNNMSFILKSKGNSVKGGQAGDLIVRIFELPHLIYIRNGNDLKMSLSLSYQQLVLGDKIIIDTIEGGEIKITIPENSEVGSNLKITNKGLLGFNSKNRGDLIINLTINLPKNLTDEQKEYIRNLNNVLAK